VRVGTCICDTFNAITVVCAVVVVMQSCARSKAVSGLFRVRRFTVSQCRHRSDELQLNPNIQSPEKTKVVTSFYFQPAIDQAAAKVSLDLTALVLAIPCIKTKVKVKYCKLVLFKIC